MDSAAAARRYYQALDDHEYDALADLLAPEFTHVRPDRTLDSRERFVSFMREERPLTDTVHALDAVFAGTDDAGPATEVAVRGRLLADDGSELFAFVDVFRFVDGAAVELQTFTQ